MNNPYSAPGAALSGAPAGDETYEPKVFAWKGRIGRLRYMAYLFGISLLNMVPVMVLMSVLGATGMMKGNVEAITGLSVLLYLPLLVFSFVLAKRRFNDTNRSGWLSLLLWIPLVNFFVSLYLVFAAGSEGANDYGPAPSPNSTIVKVVGFIFPFIFVVGVLAAIAVPAYQGYVQKARAASGSTGL
ncbi:DUF805 domain-containing protein [Pseudoduganella sp. LjRoot289]|uniref:DUF805 domain-containing protein n=1 Tax=Pseudoduganella sp. LjRoot289 TaxID=3342314 RepID=UPI003ECC7F86